MEIIIVVVVAVVVMIIIILGNPCSPVHHRRAQITDHASIFMSKGALTASCVVILVIVGTSGRGEWKKEKPQ